MAKLWQTLFRRGTEKRYSVDDYLKDTAFIGGHTYPVVGYGASQDREEVENNFVGYIRALYKSNGPVFATILARLKLFTAARFMWQHETDGVPGELFWNQDLGVLRRPWPNGGTGELLARMEQDVSLAGQPYIARVGNRLRRLRPDWVSIVLTAPPQEAVESDVAGYLYRPGGLAGSTQGKVYLPDEVSHWSPIPDPEAQYRGMSWLTPVVREVLADKAATVHKGKFFDNAATPNLAVSFKESVTKDQFEGFMKAMNESHQGTDNAYKTLYLGGGADVTVVGADLKQLDFKLTQGAGETRIAAAGGVPPIIVGLSEGLAHATYSNATQARRLFGDGWARPQWESACEALETVVKVPGQARLFYDDRHIAFLREDRLDAAEISFRQAQTIRALTDSGYTAETVVPAVLAEDFSLLRHSGLFSVQLQPPGTGQTGDDGAQSAA